MLDPLEMDKEHEGEDTLETTVSYSPSLIFRKAKKAFNPKY